MPRRLCSVELDLSTYDPSPVEIPEGIDIVTWAERPELAHGLYEVACEALPDIPGSPHERIERYERWLSVHMQGEGDRPEGRSSRSPGTRSSATPSSASGTASPACSFTTSPP